jgi:uncharacterized membrane protein YphA (DoxX/SURF4 family)
MSKLNFILRLVVGGVFILAGVVKIWNVQVKTTYPKHTVAITLSAANAPDLSKFATDVTNYRVPPRALSNLVAITLPGIEVLAGVLLVLGIWVRPSALVINCLMIVFLLAIAQAVARGLDIKCGCFGTVEGRKVGLVALAEDAVMLGMAAWLAWREKD